MEKNAKIIMLILCLFALTACQAKANSSKLDLSVLEELLAMPQSPEMTEIPYEDCVLKAIGEEVYLEIDRLDVPQGFQPLGQLDAARGYLLAPSRQKLLLYHFPSASLEPIVDVEGKNSHLGEQITFNQRWLIWVEVDEFSSDTAGRTSRLCRLMAWDQTTPGSEAVELDRGTTSPAEGAFLPFDSLDVDGDYLLYRFSAFNYGWRDTQVKLINLGDRSSKTLMAAAGSGGKMILSCSIDDMLAVWDVQTAVDTSIVGLPAMQKAYYDLYRYQIDPRKLALNENPLKRVTMNRSYYTPIVYRGQVLALDLLAESVAENTMLQHIVQINPELQNIKKIVHSFARSSGSMPLDFLDPGTVSEAFYDELLFTYKMRDFARSISFSNLRISKRILHWESNVADQNIVYDAETLSLIALPIFFEENNMARDGSFFSRSLPGLDADYIYFELVDQNEPGYILRIE